ncbi:MAG: cytochrome c [Chitinophagaceae bacterium]
MSRLIFCILATLLLTACQSGTDQLFQPGAITSQFFTIPAGKDTTLRTKQGAIIEIPKGAFQTNGSSVQLEIKEAYHLSEMIRAGLTTQSNGQLLSSGGMIYINAVGENTVKITEAIKVAIPSRELKDMQLFKGEQDGDGNINWTDPAPLAKETYSPITAGKTLFTKNCTSCHAVNKDLTGPALAYISKRRDEHYLYAFTRNSQELIKYGDMYGNQLARCVYEQWNRTPMNLFPNFTDEDMQNLYAYIESASDSSALPYISDDVTQECIDSCEVYYRMKDMLKWKKDSLIKDNGAQLEETRHPDTSDKRNNTIIESDSLPEIDMLPPIVPEQHPGLYYKFTIESFGWYNVDVLLKAGPGVSESNLMVRIQGTYRERLNVYIVIPSARIFAAAGKKNDNYVFSDTEDGKVFLPVNTKAYIMVMGDREDDILFAMSQFYVQDKNQLELSPAVVTKAQFNQFVSKLNFEQLNIKLEDAKNADDLRKTVKDLKAAELLKPKGCNCDCGLTQPAASDTAVSEYY